MIRLALLIAIALIAVVTRPALADDGICIAPSSDSISAEVAAATYETLRTAPALPSTVACWAISNVSELSHDEYLVSIVGLNTPDAANWNFQDNTVWTGLIAMTRIDGVLTGVIQGDSNFVPTLQDMPIDPDTQTLLSGGGTTETQEVFEIQQVNDVPYFPFAAGTSAVYGIRGVHSHGNLSAVDFLGYYAEGMMPNAVYAAYPGVVTSICRDDTQMGLRIGPFYYLHLVNNPNIVEGQYFSLHEYIGQLVTGSFDDTCGYAEQQASHYHLHFAFAPSQGGVLFMENWMLSVNTEEWTYINGTSRSPGQLIGPADWNGVIPEPPPQDPPEPGEPPPGGDPPITPPSPGANNNGTNFWSFLVGGFRNIVTRIAGFLPQHQSIDLAVTVSGYAALPIQIIYMTGVMNYTLAFIIVGIIIILETVRFIYSIWMWIKRAIPIIG